MSVFDSLRALFRRGGGSNIQVIYSVRAANVLGMSPTELYRKQPALRAVVSYIADNVADVPIKCYVRKGDADRPRDTTSSLALLLARPSRGKTPYELKRGIVSDILIYDHALLVVLPDASAPSGWSTRHIPWSWVDLSATSDGFEPSQFVVTNPYTGGRAEFDAEDCIHFHGYDPAGGMGATSPIDALREVLSEQISAWGFRNSVWRNGGRVTQFITRPVNAAQWEPNERARFAKSWKEKFAGDGGTNTGGTPLLEDGMELKSIPFNAREAEWAEATRLSRSDVAAVYHVNPSLIWHDSTQTYASAKDNARALYSEALSPIMTMVQEKLNARLVEMLGMDASLNYCEFDISSKLAASFEEQASVLQSSVGGPWMLRNEARARMNLPALPGGDELIVPLNVTEGGLASPNDTDPTKGAHELPITNRMPLPDMSDAFVKAFASALAQSMQQAQDQQAKALPDVEGRQIVPFDKAEVRVQAKAKLEVELSVRDVLVRFCSRQRDTYIGELAKLDLGETDIVDAIGAIFSDKSGTWLRDAIADLFDCTKQPMSSAATRSMALLEADPDDLDDKAVSALVRDMCVKHANTIAAGARDNLVKAAEALEDTSPRSIRTLVHDTFRTSVDPYVEGHARSMSTNVANAGTCEGARQSRVKCQKEWACTGHNSRDSHVRIDGERIALDEKFSNGAMWPGDPSLPAMETCNCRCMLGIVSGKDRASGKELRKYRNDVARADKAIFKARTQYQQRKTPENYQETIGKVVESFTIDGKVSAAWKACPLGKELLSAMACSANGHSVEFLATSGNGGHPDIMLDGVVFDFKRPESFVPNAIYTLLKKARNQGAKGAVIDLVLDRIVLKDALSAARRAIEDGILPRGSVIILDRHGGEHYA